MELIKRLLGVSNRYGHSTVQVNAKMKKPRVTCRKFQTQSRLTATSTIVTIVTSYILIRNVLLSVGDKCWYMFRRAHESVCVCVVCKILFLLEHKVCYIWLNLHIFKKWHKNFCPFHWLKT